MDEVFVGRVVIVAHYTPRPHMMLKEPMILVPSHAIVEQVLINRGIHMMSVSQIEGEEAFLVEPAGIVLTIGGLGVKVLRRFTLNEDGVRTLFENGVHGQHVCFAQILECCHERAIAGKSLVPPAKLS